MRVGVNVTARTLFVYPGFPEVNGGLRAMNGAFLAA